MKTIVLVNWKANLTTSTVNKWLDTFINAYRPQEQVEIILAVPVLWLQGIAEKVRPIAGVALASQYVSPYPLGSYTGSVPAAWLKDLVKYVLVGHRERRHYFHETIQDVARQANEALAEELQPIVCINRDQLSAQSASFSTEELDKLIWAYTPKDGIQLEPARDLQAIDEAVMAIGKRIGNRPILYGGGVTAGNGKAIADLPGVAGIMLGRGGLDAKAFVGLINGF